MDEIINDFNNSKKITDEQIIKSANDCINRNNAMEGMKGLKELAKDCKTKKDYIDFFKNTLKLDVEESENGMIMHLHKKECTCPMSSKLNMDKRRLCDCTKEHERLTWSEFFGKKLECKIVESFHRGGNDCVIELIF